MSTLYLLDNHNAASIPLSRIIDVIRGPWLDVPLNGKFFTTVPDDMVLDPAPTTAIDLSNAKYTELLIRYPGYTNIIYDDFLVDNLGYAGSSLVGDRVTVAMTVGAELDSNNAVLSYAPTHVVFLLDVFEQDTVYVDGRQVSRLKPSDVSNVGCTLYFDMNAVPVTPGMYTNIPSDKQGTNFQMIVTNTSPNKVIWVGGWSMVY